MATVTVAKATTTYTLEIDEAEAQYVYQALQHVEPAKEQWGDDGTDPIYEALGAALRESGAYPYGIYAQPV